MSTAIFDIETVGFTEDELRAIYVEPTFEEFAASCDKRWKEETVAAKYEASKETNWRKFVDKAALSATTGRVLCIGYLFTATDTVVIDAGESGTSDGFPTDEARLLNTFWQHYRRARAASNSLIGLNIHDFDLPFITRRSWMLGVTVPETAIEQFRYWDRLFVDLRRVWLLGQRDGSTPSNFNVLGQAMGTGGKNGHTGADFAGLWESDRAAAIEYLESDLKQPAEWAERMGIL